MNAQQPSRRPARDRLAWDDLNTVLAVARGGSLSAAARALGVNHSTVSRRLAALEVAAGHTLFRRLARGYQPTAAGERLVDAAERMESEFRGLEQVLGGRDIRVSGSVRVTAPDDMANFLLVEPLARFRGRYPEVEIELAVDNRMLNLSRREADIAIRATSSPPPYLTGRRVCDVVCAVYAAPALAEAAGPAPGAAPPAEGPWIAWEDDGQANGIKAWLARHCAPGAIVYRSNSLANQFAAARAGLGFAALPCFLCDPCADLVRVGPPPEAMSTGLWILSHPDLRRAARVTALTDFLYTEIRRRAPQLGGRGTEQETDMTGAAHGGAP